MPQRHLDRQHPGLARWRLLADLARELAMPSGVIWRPSHHRWAQNDTELAGATRSPTFLASFLLRVVRGYPRHHKTLASLDLAAAPMPATLASPGVNGASHKGVGDPRPQTESHLKLHSKLKTQNTKGALPWHLCRGSLSSGAGAGTRATWPGSMEPLGPSTPPPTPSPAWPMCREGPLRHRSVDPEPQPGLSS